ncbi:MAG: beta-ketoacyl-ACP synthase II [bacterium]|nr:beta-ketoacyl-ACP synthase II [bacterium]
MKRRVVITGLGAITPFGIGLERLWDGLINKKSGIIKMDWDPAKLPCRIAGIVSDFNPDAFIPRAEARRMDRFLQFAIVGAEMAYRDSGLDKAELDRDNTGVIIGSGIGGMSVFEKNTINFFQTSKVSPFFIPMIITNMASGMVAIRLKLRGPNFAVTSACATSNHSIGVASDMIRVGRADVMFAGGAESATFPMGIQGFAIMKAVSTRNDEPQKASRPFDRDRDGFVMGEGAGVVILEELEHAKKRQARIYAELIGFGMSDDAYDMVAPCEDGTAAALSMDRCIKDAGLRPEDVQYINAHGTSTPIGDVAECNAIKNVFKAHTKKLMVSSTKSMIGHLLGAAGGVELIATILGMQHGVVLPTINLDNQDPAIDLDCVPHQERKVDLKVAMSNSFGFGGHNSTIMIRKYED